MKKPTKAAVVTHLRECGTGADFLVLWLDCYREGEAIAFEVVDVVSPVMSGSRRLGPQGGILRAKFSAVTPADIRKALAKDPGERYPDARAMYDALQPFGPGAVRMAGDRERDHQRSRAGTRRCLCSSVGRMRPQLRARRHRRCFEPAAPEDAIIVIFAPFFRTFIWQSGVASSRVPL